MDVELNLLLLKFLFLFSTLYALFLSSLKTFSLILASNFLGMKPLSQLNLRTVVEFALVSPVPQWHECLICLNPRGHFTKFHLA
ncbi:hypothetical protein PRUPE_4G262400 [Prunus persica]|uniref:Uncharacterized protein n=1 Tax=Prunus persica TaxID=3760 RepID=A0A251PRC1_PRUPE|nr:hypothetical protein PRUPE_4G262400 [Prunus persica]